jgi:hypothetical protein
MQGKILDADGEPIIAANVIVESPNLQGKRGAATNDLGNFLVLTLPVGEYSVRIQHLGYQEVNFQNITISLGKTTTLGEIILEVQTIEMPAITVSADIVLIDPTSTKGGGNLDSDVYSDLPVERDYRSIATLLPQVNVSFLGDEANFAGATGLENKYFVDGIETTDPFRGVTGTTLPYNLVREIELKTGGYEAEYRSSLGGILNAITYSGGNDFHGQVFGFFANKQFSGDERRPALAPPTGDFAQYDFGFGLGGPIILDKLWFFVAYNPKVEREDIEIPGQGFSENKITNHIFAGKLTWRATQKTNVVFSINGDPGKTDAVGVTVRPLPVPVTFTNPDPYLMNLERGGMNISLAGTHVASNKILIESSLSHIRRKDKNQPATDLARNEPLFIGIDGTWSGGSSGSTKNLSVQSTFRINGTLQLRKHLVKAGFEYRDNQLDFKGTFTVDGQRAPDFFLRVSEASQGKVHSRIPSLFVQDAWQISNRLGINVGLRWDGQYLIGSNGKLAQKITNQYQPRIGVVYQPGKVGSQKLFGSFGRFYQELALFLSFIHHNEDFFSQVIQYDHDFRVDPSGGDTNTVSGAMIQPAVENLQGQYYDEFTLGYEREFGGKIKIGARGIYRTLRQGIENSWVPDRATGEFLYGNPGKGAQAAFPKMKRDYTAFELTVQKSGGRKYNILASYVLSRNYGNYAGLFTSDIVPQLFPNANGAFNILEAMENSTGLLPNDRTHVFKLSGFYRLKFGLIVGSSFFWQTGKPKSEFGFNQNLFVNYFLQERGSVGRLSSIWDLNFRFVYDLSLLTNTWWKPRLILDIFHIGSQREPVAREEVRYNAVDNEGNPVAPNPNYDSAILFQPPMTLRFGVEVDF